MGPPEGKSLKLFSYCTYLETMSQILQIFLVHLTSNQCNDCSTYKFFLAQMTAFIEGPIQF